MFYALRIRGKTGHYFVFFFCVRVLGKRQGGYLNRVLFFFWGGGEGDLVYNIRRRGGWSSMGLMLMGKYSDGRGFK